MRYEAVIVGGGVTGLACARVLAEHQISCTILERSARPGGRIKTDLVDGFTLDLGFQVLQTGYPELSTYLDLDALILRRFPAGIVVRCQQRFHVIADPRHHPRYLLSTTVSPVGTLGDRLRLLRLARRICRQPMEDIFENPEEKAIDFLRKQGFTERFITSFFTPFLAGACLDRSMTVTSRVLEYLIRLFASGDAALPEGGMQAIPHQLAAGLAPDTIQYDKEVVELRKGSVLLTGGEVVEAPLVVVATEQPAVSELVRMDESKRSIGETCLYFGARWLPPFAEPFLVLNGEGNGPINNLAFPSMVSPSYAPAGKTLIAVVVLGEEYLARPDLEDLVIKQCQQWFGPVVKEWQHLKTYRIEQALPDQSPPTLSPYRSPEPISPGLYICGEQQGLPGLGWALMSGGMTGSKVSEIILKNRTRF